MVNLNKNNFLFEDVASIKGVGNKLKRYLKNKKIEKVKDLLWDLPYEVSDRSKITEISKQSQLEIKSVDLIYPTRTNNN